MDNELNTIATIKNIATTPATILLVFGFILLTLYTLSFKNLYKAYYNRNIYFFNNFNIFNINLRDVYLTLKIKIL